MKQEIHATTVRVAFSYFRENNIQLREKKQICGWVMTASKGYSGDNCLK